MAVLLDREGKKLAAGDIIVMGPNLYGVPKSTRGKILGCLESGSVRVRLFTERGAEIRVVHPSTLTKA